MARLLSTDRSSELESIKDEVSDEACYHLWGKRMSVSWVCTDVEMSEFAKKPFDSRWAKTRGFINLMHALEDVAVGRGCEHMVITTWMFASHSALMARLGYAPADQNNAERHAALAASSRAVNNPQETVTYFKKLK